MPLRQLFPPADHANRLRWRCIAGAAHSFTPAIRGEGECGPPGSPALGSPGKQKRVQGKAAIRVACALTRAAALWDV